MIFSISWSNDCLISIVVILLLLLFFALNVSEHDNCFNIVVSIANINKKKKHRKYLIIHFIKLR